MSRLGAQHNFFLISPPQFISFLRLFSGRTSNDKDNLFLKHFSATKTKTFYSSQLTETLHKFDERKKKEFQKKNSQNMDLCMAYTLHIREWRRSNWESVKVVLKRFQTK